MIYAPSVHSNKLKWVARLIILLPFLSCISIFILININSSSTTSQVTLPIMTTDVQSLNKSTLYHIEAQAKQTGWTEQLHRQAGDLRYSMSDFYGATAHWEAANITDALTLQRLADIYIKQQRWTDATNILTRLVANKNNHSWANYYLGLIKAPIDPSGAIIHLSIAARVSQYSGVAFSVLEVVQAHATDPFVSMYVGKSFALHALWPYAEYAFRHAAIIGNPYPEALAYLGLSRAQQGKNGQEWMEQAILLGESKAEVYYVYGLYLRLKDDLEASWQAFVQATMLAPDNPAYYAELGVANQLLQNYDEAAHWFRIALSASNNSPEFQEMLAAYYAQEGFNLSSNNLPFLQDIAHSNITEDPDLYANLGWSLFILGDADGGLNQINSALALNPHSEKALYYKAYILIYMNNFEEAKPYVLQLITSSDIIYRDWAQETLRQFEVTPEVQISND